MSYAVLALEGAIVLEGSALGMPVRVARRDIEGVEHLRLIDKVTGDRAGGGKLH
jgi:hypothetical protein